MAARKNGKQPEWADTLDDIKDRRTMDVTLLSGAKVTLRTVTLDELAAEDGLPGDLIEVAILDSADLLLPQMLDEVRHQRVEEAQRLSQNLLDLTDAIALRAIVAPKPVVDTVRALDQFDRRMILEIAQRKRSEDAVGKVIAAQRLADFDTFREGEVGGADSEAGGEDGVVADPVA